MAGIANIGNIIKARFFVNGQYWNYDSTGLGGVVKRANTGPAVDCNEFVYESLLAAGYNVSKKIATETMIDIINGGASSDYTMLSKASANGVASDIAAGSLVVFSGPHGGHVGIVQYYDPVQKGDRFIFPAPNSALPASHS